MIHLHYWPTPNGKKVTILLEELGLPYTIVPSLRGGHSSGHRQYQRLQHLLGNSPAFRQRLGNAQRRRAAGGGG
jgi:glutathione S-transferase